MSNTDNKNKDWLAVYTKSRSEKKVSGRLTNAGFEVYCPIRKEIRIWSDRKKKVEVPVFPSYVFVHVDEKERLKVLETPGVMNFVFWLGKPAIIRDQEVEKIRVFLSEHPQANSRAIQVKTGQKVGIKEGQLKDSKGVVTEVRNTTVIVRIESAGFELFAEVSKSTI